MDRRMDGWMNGLLCACLIRIVTACNVCVVSWKTIKLSTQLVS